VALLKVPPVRTVLTSASQSTLAERRTEAAASAVSTTSSLASDDDVSWQDWLRYGVSEVTTRDNGFSDGVGGLLIFQWIGGILHLAMEGLRV
jgi:hypothetical protein